MAAVMPDCVLAAVMAVRHGRPSWRPIMVVLMAAVDGCRHTFAIAVVMAAIMAAFIAAIMAAVMASMMGAVMATVMVIATFSA